MWDFIPRLEQHKEIVRTFNNLFPRVELFHYNLTCGHCGLWWGWSVQKGLWYDLIRYILSGLRWAMGGGWMLQYIFVSEDGILQHLSTGQQCLCIIIIIVYISTGHKMIIRYHPYHHVPRQHHYHWHLCVGSENFRHKSFMVPSWSLR